MLNFTEDSVPRIIINPFYAITVIAQLTREHEPAISEAEWVQANTSLMQAMGAEQWLRQLLDVLEGKVGTADQTINPSRLSTLIRCLLLSIHRLSNGICGSMSMSNNCTTWGERNGCGNKSMSKGIVIDREKDALFK